MITARQVRAARALLGWTQETLAETALVSLTALKRLETHGAGRVHESTLVQVQRALEKAGIVFIESARGHGVMLVQATENPPSN